MKLIVIGIGGSGASCIEVLVHLTALGLLPDGTELIPVMVDPDQQHPRIQATSRFIAAHAELRRTGGVATEGLLGTKISRVVNANALRPSELASLFNLLELAQPMARTLGTLFFAKTELGEPGSHEFDDGYYGRVNAGVCFFNDTAGRLELMAALRQHALGGDAAVVLIGSAFGGTGAAGLIHLARVFREDQQLRNVPFKIGAIQLEPYFRPDWRDDIRADRDLVNVPDTFEGRTGAAYQFLANLAANGHLPFDAFYPLGVRIPASFPPEWFKRDKQNNPHLFIEYVAALAVRDFAINRAELTESVRHCREAVPPFQGPLGVLRESLFDATVLHALLRSYLVPLLERVTHATSLPGHPWIATVCAKSGLRPAQLLEQLNSISGLLADILVASGLDRQLSIDRAGASEVEQRAAERRNDLTRASFPSGFAPRAENFDVVQLLRHASPEAMFDSYDVGSDGKLALRALYRWIREALHPPQGDSYCLRSILTSARPSTSGHSRGWNRRWASKSHPTTIFQRPGAIHHAQAGIEPVAAAGGSRTHVGRIPDHLGACARAPGQAVRQQTIRRVQISSPRTARLRAPETGPSRNGARAPRSIDAAGRSLSAFPREHVSDGRGVRAAHRGRRRPRYLRVRARAGYPRHSGRAGRDRLLLPRDRRGPGGRDFAGESRACSRHRQVRRRARLPSNAARGHRQRLDVDAQA